MYKVFRNNSKKIGARPLYRQLLSITTKHEKVLKRESKLYNVHGWKRKWDEDISPFSLMYKLGTTSIKLSQ